MSGDVSYVRSYLSFQHLRSAVHFAQLALKVEREEGRQYPDHLAYATASVFCTVAFLEATINEVYRDAHEGILPDFVSAASLAKMYDFGVNMSTLQKYQIALMLAGQESFNPGENPYQDIDTVIRLRNALIHFEPENIQVHPEPGSPHRLESRLRGKFSPNPFHQHDTAVFPHRYFSGDGARWAILSSVRFVEEFGNRIGPAVFPHGTRPDFTRLLADL